jgi:hypothetical protein
MIETTFFFIHTCYVKKQRREKERINIIIYVIFITYCYKQYVIKIT